MWNFVRKSIYLHSLPIWDFCKKIYKPLLFANPRSGNEIYIPYALRRINVKLQKTSIYATILCELNKRI